MALASAGALGGVVLFRRNIDSDQQLIDLVGQVYEAFAGQATPIIAVDQEGGRVQRLIEPRVSVAPIPAMRALGDAGLRADQGSSAAGRHHGESPVAQSGPTGESVRYLDFRDFEELGARVGHDLRRFGFNLDFAPVLDVDTNPDNPIIGDRAFGRTPEEVVFRALAFARGLERAGVLWCGKHFPGHGDTSVDSHLALPSLEHGWSRLEAVELAPFAAAVAVGAPMIMTAHIIYTALDAERPATLSSRVVPQILRGTLGYDGVVASDDLEMKAIRDHFDVGQIADGLNAADVDLALVCSDLPLAVELAKRLEPRPDAERRLGALRRRLSR